MSENDLQSEITACRWRECEHGAFRLRTFIDGPDKGYRVEYRTEHGHPKRLGIVRRATGTADEVAKRVVELWGRWKAHLEEHFGGDEFVCIRARILDAGFVHYYDTNSGDPD